MSKNKITRAEKSNLVNNLTEKKSTKNLHASAFQRRSSKIRTPNLGRTNVLILGIL